MAAFAMDADGLWRRELMPQLVEDRSDLQIDSLGRGDGAFHLYETVLALPRGSGPGTLARITSVQVRLRSLLIHCARDL
jgi:hypothetical protein